MVFAILWFGCALVSFWLMSWITYKDCNVMTKRDFIAGLAMCIVAAPLMLAGFLIGIVIDYINSHGEDEVHFMDRFFKKGGKDEQAKEDDA